MSAVLPDGITRFFQRGESVPIWGWSEQSDVFADPSEGLKVTLKKPDGTAALDYDDITEITDLAMSKDETGKYVFNFRSKVSMDAGIYKGWITAQDGSGAPAWITTTPFDFTLETRS